MKTSMAGTPAWLGALWAASGVMAGCMTFGGASADVTIQQQSVFDISIFKAHSDSTEYTAADKQRQESVLHCEGLMSLACGNTETDEIIRLDRDVQWNLTPKKKEYRETPFLTPAQRQQQMQELQAELDKMKQCPTPPQQQQAAPAPDQSKCQMSPPKYDVQRTNTHATLIGHDARLTQMTMTQSCTNPDTGDTCDFVIGMDTWLTEDQIAGFEDKRAFETAYAHKLGIDATTGIALQAQVKRLLAPYESGLKQLSAKAGDIKGYPLKTAFRISFGGPHCAAAQNQNQNGAGAQGAGGSTSSGSGGASSIPLSVGSAASALGGKLVGGLFSKKKDPAADASTTPTPPLPPGMIQAAQFTVETTAITVGPVAPTQFDIPAGWKLVQPEVKAPKEFSCPKT